jgi:phage nucleotide-binding protein
MPLQLTNTKNANLECFKGVIYGTPGVGKTTLARTLMPLGKVLIVSCESGLKPLQGLDIDVYECKSYKDLSNFLIAFHKGELDAYAAIFIDSLTEIGKAIEQHYFNLFAEVDDKGVRDVPKTHNFKYYGAVARDLEMFVRAIRDRNKQHVFFTALAHSWEDKNTGLSGVRPALVGQKVSEMLPGLFDFVFSYRLMPDPQSGDMVRVVFTQTYEGHFAKARQPVDAPALPLAIKSPSLTEIVRAVTINTQGTNTK